MRVYVVLYRDLWLKASKVSQEGYRRLCDAQDFCKNRLKVYENPKNPALYQRGEHVFGNAITKEEYTIVEVSV